ncbi:MAG: zinc ribbon domain-containing protein [Nitrospirae bacterium]|nr:zinc ribbon domain-containing protein [Nitrospirota bacterium]
MPIYEYVCQECSEKFSLLQSVHAGDNDAKCPKCASQKVKKVMSSFCCSVSGDAGFSSSVPSRGSGGG